MSASIGRGDSGAEVSSGLLRNYVLRTAPISVIIHASHFSYSRVGS